MQTTTPMRSRKNRVKTRTALREVTNTKDEPRTINPKHHQGISVDEEAIENRRRLLAEQISERLSHEAEEKAQRDIKDMPQRNILLVEESAVFDDKLYFDYHFDKDSTIWDVLALFSRDYELNEQNSDEDDVNNSYLQIRTVHRG
jgi:hypothetical protein